MYYNCYDLMLITILYCVWPHTGCDVTAARSSLLVQRLLRQFGQLLDDACIDIDLQRKLPVLPCITKVWNNKECHHQHINETACMQRTPRVTLVGRTSNRVIDR